MKKFAALVLTLVSLFTFTTVAFAGDEPLYEANEIALELEEIFGYKFEVTLKIKDIPFVEGEDEVYFEIFNSLRDQYYYWNPEHILGQYVLTEESLWELVDTYPTWEMLPWESVAPGRHFWYLIGASEQFSKVIEEEHSLSVNLLSDETLKVIFVVGDEEICQILESGDFAVINDSYVLSQSVLTDLYREWQER